MTIVPNQPKVDTNIDTSEPIVPFPPGMAPAAQQPRQPENVHLCLADIPPEGQSPLPLMQCRVAPADNPPEIHTCRYEV